MPIVNKFFGDEGFDYWRVTKSLCDDFAAGSTSGWAMNGVTDSSNCIDEELGMGCESAVKFFYWVKMEKGINGPIVRDNTTQLCLRSLRNAI